VGFRVSLPLSQTVTVLIAYYNPARARHLPSQVRNLLKCSFVDRIVISNHNPRIDLAPLLAVPRNRVVLVSNKEERGCGYRWRVAQRFKCDYLIVIDDDMLLFPSQIARLFMHLVSEPSVPHGTCGMLQVAKGDLEYHAEQEMTVDCLSEVYALTTTHLTRYAALEARLSQDIVTEEAIQCYADFAVISRTGAYKPKIHNVGHLFRCATFKETGIAVHRKDGFREAVRRVLAALDGICEATAELTGREVKEWAGQDSTSAGSNMRGVSSR
jgi:hypothetical protein